MQGKTRTEVYRVFLDFVANDLQHERKSLNRRMKSVFIWCLVLPALTSLLIFFLIKFQFLPRSARALIDSTLLVFPVAYSLYVLGSEVLMRVPKVIRQGGAATTLNEAYNEVVWRERVCEALKRSLDIQKEEWLWVVESFHIDLERMRTRTRFMTALAGAVLYLLFQGIDLLGGGTEPAVSWIKTPVGWMETSGDDFSQFIGLGLFLVLFYTSGMQMSNSFERYLNCVRLVANDRK